MTNTPASRLPSLLSENAAPAALCDSGLSTHTLLDLLYDGFYALFLLKHRCAPKNEANFSVRMQQFLHDYERQAKRVGASAEDIHASKYAFCATVDELVLCSQFDIRHAWQTRPLQLVMFGDQLAGENFFKLLDTMRSKGSLHLQVLEVFHMCLLLGFRGKYMLESPEKLGYFIHQLGSDIAHMKGKPNGFAPQAERPDNIVNRLRSNLSIWAVCSLLAFVGLIGYAGIHWELAGRTQSSIHGFNEIVKLAPKAANITITWQ